MTGGCWIFRPLPLSLAIFAIFFLSLSFSTNFWASYQLIDSSTNVTIEINHGLWEGFFISRKEDVFFSTFNVSCGIKQTYCHILCNGDSYAGDNNSSAGRNVGLICTGKLEEAPFDKDHPTVGIRLFSGVVRLVTSISVVAIGVCEGGAITISLCVLICGKEVCKSKALLKIYAGCFATIVVAVINASTIWSMSVFGFTVPDWGGFERYNLVLVDKRLGVSFYLLLLSVSLMAMSSLILIYHFYKFFNRTTSHSSGGYKQCRL